MQLMRNLFVFTAVALMLLHSIVPHHHEQEDAMHGCNMEQDAGDLLDYLSLIFHEDLGSDHLEDFLPSSPAQVFLVPDPAEDFDPKTSIQVVSRCIPQTLLTDSGFTDPISGRGPPFLTFV